MPCDVIVSQTVFGESRKTCTTTMRKFCRSANYDEDFTLKVYQNTDEIAVSVMNWRRGIAGKKIGSVAVSIKVKAFLFNLHRSRSSRTKEDYHFNHRVARVENDASCVRTFQEVPGGVCSLHSQLPRLGRFCLSLSLALSLALCVTGRGERADAMAHA